MKHISIFSLLILSCTFLHAQLYRATIKQGSKPNSVIIAVRPSGNTTNVQIGTINIAIAIPATVNPKPIAAISDQFGFTFTYSSEAHNNPFAIAGKGNYFIYDFAGDGPVSAETAKSFTSASDNNIVEITFSGGPLSTSEVLIVNLPGGGPAANSYFYLSDKGVGINDENNLFYGTGAVQGVGGQESTSYVGVSDIALPVNFLSFYALKNADNAKLSWTVENDMENKQFEVERSTNGRDFTKIQTIAALNNGRSNNTYETVDLGISKHGSSEVFYQIKQIDRDGQSTRSAVRKLSIDGTGKAVSVFPNPMRTTAKVIVDAPEAGRGSIVLRDAVGRQVQMINAQFHKGINNFDLNVATLISGEYNIQVVGPGLSQNVKVSKIQ